MSSFGEILADLKKNEEPENIVALIDDEELQNGMIAWKSVQIRYKTPSDCQEKDSAGRWNWLWAQIEYDANRFGVVAGAKAQDVGKLVDRLVGLRLIYPDGTINTLARQFLQAKIMKQIGGFSRAKTPPAQQNAPKT